MNRIFYTLLAGFLALSTGTAARAQFWDATGAAVGGTVQGTGTVTIERQPQRMQMEVDILFRAGSVEDAVAGLREQIEIARLQLGKLGATEDSITVGEPSIYTQQSDQQQMMQQMITPSLLGSGRSQPEAETQKPVTVTAVMTAAWELDQADTADLLVRTHGLQEQIRKADVAGSEAATKLTPEEQEVLEEMQQQYGSYGSDEANPGEPLFYFVADITDAEYRQALANAFQEARARAQELAAATGSELGALESVVSNSQADIDSYEYNYGYGYQSTYYRAYQQLSNRGYGSGYGTPPNGPRIAIGVKPGKVSYNVSVSAGFALKGD